MRGEAGEESASPATASAAPAPITPPGGFGRELKTRIWLGVPLAISGGYLIGDTEVRLQLAWDVITAWWPWVLLALAATNVLRSVLQFESLLAPGLLAFVALGALGIREGVATRTFVDVVIPAVIALVGVVLLLSVGTRLTGSWTRILVTGHVTAPEFAPRGMRPRAILGELKADLTTLATPPEEVQVTAVLGHVRLTIPAAWRLNLHATGALLTPIRGLIGAGPPEVTLRVLGFCGVVSVVRAAQAIPATREEPVA